MSQFQSIHLTKITHLVYWVRYPSVFTSHLQSYLILLCYYRYVYAITAMYICTKYVVLTSS